MPETKLQLIKSILKNKNKNTYLSESTVKECSLATSSQKVVAKKRKSILISFSATAAICSDYTFIMTAFTNLRPQSTSKSTARPSVPNISQLPPRKIQKYLVPPAKSPQEKAQLPHGPKEKTNTTANKVGSRDCALTYTTTEIQSDILSDPECELVLHFDLYQGENESSPSVASLVEIPISKESTEDVKAIVSLAELNNLKAALQLTKQENELLRKENESFDSLFLGQNRSEDVVANLQESKKALDAMAAENELLHIANDELKLTLLSFAKSTAPVQDPMLRSLSAR